MKFHFAMKLLFFLTFIAISKPQENKSDSEEVITSSLFPIISRCILYRFISYQEDTTGIVPIEKNNADNSYQIKEPGISYRYVPCLENWTALTIMYETKENYFQTENIRLKCNINQCQIDRIQHKNDSDQRANVLNEEKRLQEFNLTECLNEEKSKHLWFDNQIKNCEISNNYLSERIATAEMDTSKLESDLVWCLSVGKNKTLFIVTETKNCQQQNFMLNYTISICNEEKLIIRSNHTECLIDRKDESFLFTSEITNCENQKNSSNDEVLNCEAEMKSKQINLTECQATNRTQSLEIQLEKCKHLSSQLNEKLSNCDTANILLESNLNGCLNEVKKNTSQLNAEIKNYQNSYSSGNELFSKCETEKRKANTSLIGCLTEGENKTSFLQAEINKTQTNISALNLILPVCKMEKTKTESNFTGCLIDLKNKTGYYKTEINNCQDLRNASDEKLLIFEKEKKKIVANLTSCLNILDDENLQKAMAYAKKYQDLSLSYKNKSETCKVEKRKLETNLTGCLTESKTKIMAMEDDIRNYQISNYSLSEKISICNIEKRKMASRLGECITDTKNKTILLQTTTNEFQKTNSTLNGKIATCNTERTAIMVNLTVCLSDAKATAQYNSKKDPFINYISLIWKGTSFPINYNSPTYESIVVYDRYNIARLGIFPMVDAESLKPWYGPVINDVLSYRYPISMPQCTSSSLPSLYVAVISTPGSFQTRDRIRKDLKTTIVSQTGVIGKISFGFFVELTSNPLTQTRIEEEANIHDDIIQINIVIKSYRDSTLKMAAVLNWINSYCSTVSFVFKVEEDVKFDMSKLVQIVKDHHQSTLIFLGVPADNGSLVYRGGITISKLTRVENLLNAGAY